MARTSIEQARRFYAEELRAVAPVVRNKAIVEAFATVPRESFFGRGPWHVLPWPSGYQRTPDADPRRLYRNVLVATTASAA